MHVRKGDTVEVISGNDRGKTGEVKEVLTKRGHVVVEGDMDVLADVVVEPDRRDTGRLAAGALPRADHR